jgi:hypothetical protein
MSNAVTESVEILRRRLSELDDEREQILGALRALEGVSNGASAARPRQRRRSTTARASSARTTRASSARSTRTTRATRTSAQGTTARSTRSARGRRGRGGSQADRFLKLVTDNPGITVAQAASKMGMARANALYSVASRLSREGKVTKQGTGYHVT